MEAHQPEGAIRPLRFRRRPIETALVRGREGAAGYADQPFHAAAAAKRLPHFDRSDLVGAGESVYLDRPAAPQEAGRAVGGSGPHRYRTRQPQSLRSSRSSYFAAGGGPRAIPIHRSDWGSPVAANPKRRPGP